MWLHWGCIVIQQPAGISSGKSTKHHADYIVDGPLPEVAIRLNGSEEEERRKRNNRGRASRDSLCIEAAPAANYRKAVIFYSHCFLLFHLLFYFSLILSPYPSCLSYSFNPAPGRFSSPSLRQTGLFQPGSPAHQDSSGHLSTRLCNYLLLDVLTSGNHISLFNLSWKEPLRS